MRRQALAVIEEDAELHPRFTLLLSMPGIGEISALNLLGELALLAPGLTVRQWVAHSGLDPAHHESGTSVHQRSASAGLATVTYAGPSICLPWLQYATILACAPFTRLCCPAIRPNCKRSLLSLAKCYMLSSACFAGTPPTTVHAYSRRWNSLQQSKEKGFPAPFQREKLLDSQEVFVRSRSGLDMRSSRTQRMGHPQ